MRDRFRGREALVRLDHNMTRRHQRLFGFLPMLLACGTASAAAQAPVNLGLAAYTGYVAGGMGSGRILVVVEEGAQGVDLDGDSDLGDAVVFEHHPATNTTRSLGIPVQWIAESNMVVGEQLAAIPYAEPYLQGSDPNGDGDSGDSVLHVHDLVTGTTTNLRLAVWVTDFGNRSIDVRGNRVLFAVSEAAQSADLDGDGLATHLVVHAYRRGDAAAVNLALPVVVMSGNFPPAQFALGRHHAVVLVAEGAVGVDLNGDGDQVDRVAHVHAFASGVTTNLGLAAFSVRADGDLFAMAVSEAAQGGTDLDGDGSALGFVLHAHAAPTGITSRLGYAGTSGILSRFVVGGYLIAWAEPERPGIDLNTDGDFSDVVLRTFNARNQRIRNTGMAGKAIGEGFAALPITIEGQFVASSVRENWQGGMDLNGDGSVGDIVVYVYDERTGVAQLAPYNLRDNGTPPLLSDGILVYQVSEATLGGGADINGDGRISWVCLVRDVASGSTVLLGPTPVYSNVSLRAGHLVYPAVVVGTDLNGDGYVTDVVVHDHDVTTGVGRTLPLAIYQTFVIGGSTGILCAVDEAGQGGPPLNGDGDTLDSVFHFVAY